MLPRAEVSSSFNSKIAKGESRGKQKSHFRLDYAEPQLIFVLTKIVKGGYSTIDILIFVIIMDCDLFLIYF